MNRTRSCLSVLPLLLLLFLSTSCSRTPEHILASDKELILGWMKAEKVPTLGICLIEDAKIQQIEVLGTLEYHSPAPEKTLFNLASLTKPLLSTTTLLLVSRGEWQLDEPLYHYWTDPDVANDPNHKKLTTRHVLSHQSGLPNWRGHEPDGRLSFAFEPGTQWKYSGEGFEYLRRALEIKTEAPLEVLVDSILFSPLGMKDIRYFWDENMDTTLYAERYNEEGILYEKERWYSANASNLVLSTLEDYGKFAVAVLKSRHQSREVWEEMIKPQAILDNGSTFGLGWHLIQDLSNGNYALTHTGRNRGQNTVIVLLPQEEKGIIVFTNGDRGDRVYQNILSECFDQGNEILDRMK
ncbi:MAG: serine hydrolase domain-containing protein [Bacteroidales bacterium]